MIDEFTAARAAALVRRREEEYDDFQTLFDCDGRPVAFNYSLQMAQDNAELAGEFMDNHPEGKIDGRMSMRCPKCSGSGYTGRLRYTEDSMYGEADDCPYCDDGLIWSDTVIRKLDRLEDDSTSLWIVGMFLRDGDVEQARRELGLPADSREFEDAAGI